MMYVIDLRDVAGLDEMVGPRIGGVVSAATAHPPGEAIATGLACHRRPGHKPCPGKLLVRRAEAPAQIEWACPACSEEGVISG
jgi:hypothetical protein